MSNTNTGGPAFPTERPAMSEYGKGMTLRQYAAIKLKVPDSGTYWLDDMIRKSQRDDFAAKAMQALIHDEAAEPDCGSLTEWWADVDEKLIGPERFAEAAYMMADAMLKAREA